MLNESFDTGDYSALCLRCDHNPLSCNSYKYFVAPLFSVRRFSRMASLMKSLFVIEMMHYLRLSI